MRSSHTASMLHTLEHGGAFSHLMEVVKLPWAFKMLGPNSPLHLTKETKSPSVGDVALVEIQSIGYHGKIVSVDGDRLRLHRGDIVAGVFGNRYATDAFEGEVLSLDNLHMLTNAGMIGTVLSKQSAYKQPTHLKFIGYLADGRGKVVNTKSGTILSVAGSTANNIFFVVGTSMNSGKTTAVTRLARSLLERGLRVSILKLTGSVCPHDQMEYKSILPNDIRVFSDYGFPSTYLASKEELIALFHNMIRDTMKCNPDVILVELADGLLQRETHFLLEDSEIRKFVKGVLLTATCAPSAFYGLDRIVSLGHKPVALSGMITTKPLCVKEFRSLSELPVITSFKDEFDPSICFSKN